MIASRVGDGRFDPSIVYSKPAGPGVWQPASGGAMALAWLGFLRPVVDIAPVALDGHDALTSDAYTADYDEVASVGSTTSTTRTPDQTAIAQFFNLPTISAAYRLAVCDVLSSQPLGLLPTTRLFARMDASVLTSFIQTFRLKYDVGFWRPFQAIAGAGSDGNPDTAPQTGWTPLVPNPAYSDYTSGHAAATGSWVEVVRRTLGDDTDLILRDRDAGALVRQPDGTRARHPPRADPGRAALPGRDGRRLLPGTHDCRAGDARPSTDTPSWGVAPVPHLRHGEGGATRRGRREEGSA